jgi:hypothetical protein
MSVARSATSCAAIMTSSSFLGAIPIKAATVALNCLLWSSGLEFFTQSACSVWLASVLFQ